MALSNEDNLRLNVLMAQKPKAIRIDDSKMVVYGLTRKGNAEIQLNPNCKDELYLKQVRELLSNKVMGSPGGYPVYINRWTRMGQARSGTSLEQLLLLGEPEAVVAVVHAPDISAEIAHYAWWAHPTADNARCLLEKSTVVDSPLARELCEYLLEYLPFEIEHIDMINTVRLCLQESLLTQAEVDDLWKRAKRRQSLYVGFLHTRANNLPDLSDPHPHYQSLQNTLSQLPDNPYAQLLLRLLSKQGQQYLKTVVRVIDKAASQDTIVSLFISINNYFKNSALSNKVKLNIEDSEEHAQQFMNNNEDKMLNELLETIHDHHHKVHSLLVISQVGENTLNHVFGLSDALGSVMRKKLKPVTDPLYTHISNLLP